MSQALFRDSELLLALTLLVTVVGIAIVLFLVRRVFSLDQECESLRLQGSAWAEPKAGNGRGSDLHRAIFDGLPDPIVLQDSRGRTVAANRAWRRLCGEGRREPADAPRLVNESIETADGTRWLSWAETTLAIEGRPHRLRGGREVTQHVETLRMLEEARAKAEGASEAKSRFLATVSHEFRTPLNGILGMTALLLETGMDAEQTTYAQAVRSSAEAFLTLIEDILDFSKIEAGRIDLSDEPFDLPALVQGVVELLAPRAQGKGTEIACFIGRDVPRHVRGDADRLRQVLFNLAGNAVKFTAAGGAGITVERGPDDLIRFCVADTGPGIPAERAARVFEEFEQGDQAGAAETGTGLGLAITRRLVDSMRGRIELDSVVGSGSRFQVELSLPAAPAETETVERAPVTATRALILSGSPFEGPYLARTLVEAGLEATVAATLDDALARMGGRAFDVLIADHALPDSDVRVASREAGARGIGRRIVLLSPFERRDFGSPHAAGFDGYLIKPVRARSLFEQLSARPPAVSLLPSAPRALSPPPGARRGARVLLAEDNEVNALLAVRALERLGAIVDWARDGHEALNRAEAALSDETSPFDLVLMDVRMPGLDGYEVTRRIRAREAELGAGSPLRIVALTASIVGDGGALVRDAGFDGLMTKPFAFEALAAEFGRASQAAALAS